MKSSASSIPVKQSGGQRSLAEIGTARDETAADIELAKRDVIFIQEQLTHLAVAIRRSGFKSRTLKADQTFDPNQHGDLRSHLSFLILLRRSPKRIEQIRKQHSAAISGSPQPKGTPGEILNNVQSRLVNANLRRRHRFVYAQRHDSKREGRPLIHPLAVSQSKQIPSKSQAEQSGTISGPAKAVEGAGNESQQPKDTLTDTTASKIDVPIQSQMPTRTPSQKSRTDISTTASNIEYPKPPKLDPESAQFKCPCCCLPQLSEVAKDVKWRSGYPENQCESTADYASGRRNHIAEDVRPYTCVLEFCPQPDVMYVTRNAWAQHMNRDHGGLKVWECMLCDLSTQFDSLESLESHLTCQHPGALREIRPFAEACMTTTSPQVVSCPLCSWAEDQTEPIDTETLIDHIAEHVHAFSLRSLPWASTIDKAGGEGDTRPDAEIENWISTVSHDKTDLSLYHESVTVPDQITKAPSQDVIESSAQELDLQWLLVRLNQTLGKFSQSSGVTHETEGDYFTRNQYFGENDQDSIEAAAGQDDVSVSSIGSSSSGRRSELIFDLERESARMKWSYWAFMAAKTRATRTFWIHRWFQSAGKCRLNERTWTLHRLRNCRQTHAFVRMKLLYLQRMMRLRRREETSGSRSLGIISYPDYMKRWIIGLFRTPGFDFGEYYPSFMIEKYMQEGRLQLLERLR